MIVFVATPPDAVSLPVPVIVPAPEALAKATTVELSAVTVLPAASLIVAVSTRVAPDVRFAVEPVSTMSAAAPWTTVNTSVPVVSPLAVASSVIAPASVPVTVFVATPAETVALPVPVTVPAPDCLAKAITVELSDVTTLPPASWIVAVRMRVAPEARFAVEPVNAICAAGPATTLNAPRVPSVSPAEVASIVTEPASAPVIVLVAIPPEAVALPVPATEPVPAAFANATTVELSEVIVFPAASCRAAVRTRLTPAERSAVAPVSWIWLAAPWTTVKAPRVPVVSPAAVVSIVTEPASTPVMVLVAMPLAAVALPVPLTVPAPEALAKATTVELSEVTVLPAASSIVAVSTRFEPEVRSAVEPVSAIWAAAPWTTVNAPSVPVVSPAAVASMVTEPTSWPVIVFVATPLEAVALPVPLIVPVPEALAKATSVVLSDVTVLPAASWIVAVRTRVMPEVRFAVEPVSAI